MSAPRVTAIIPTYNTAAFLPYALESVLRQGYEDWEAVVVDDGSTDNTRELVESYIPEFGGRLRYVHQENRGLSAARNTAMQHARGEIFAFLDADDLWLENRLDASVGAMDADASIGLAHAPMARINVAGEVIEIPPRPPMTFLRGRIARVIYTRRISIPSGTVTIRRTCVDRVGGFDETMRATEDRDMWFRIAEHFSVAYIDDTLAHIRRTPNSMSSDPSRMWKAQMYFLKKHLDRGAATQNDYREALATVWRELGDVYCHYGPFQDVVRCYGKSVAADPFGLGNWYALIRALADPLVQSLPSAFLPDRAVRFREQVRRARLLNHAPAAPHL